MRGTRCALRRGRGGGNTASMPACVEGAAQAKELAGGGSRSRSRAGKCGRLWDGALDCIDMGLEFLFGMIGKSKLFLVGTNGRAHASQ